MIKFNLSKTSPFVVILWFYFVILAYSNGVGFGQYAKQYAFDNKCTQYERHYLRTEDVVTKKLNHVDWCENTWWHPFRLAATLIPAILSGMLISLSISLVTSKKLTPALLTVLPVTLSIIHLISLLLESGMKEYTKVACRRHEYSEFLSAEDCLTQLGPFGDIRLYYPILVLLICLTALLLHAAKHRCKVTK